jgi:GNAT superfamily N-acetyltransferase
LIQYRQATKNDVQTLCDVAHRVIRHNYTLFLGADRITGFIESGMADKEILDNLLTCTVIIQDKQVVGFAITTDDFLHLIMIDVPFQNASYGSQLLRHTENELFAQYDLIRVRTFEENKPTLQFYLKNGWTVAGNEEIADIGLNMTLLHKRRGESSK